MKIQFYIRFQTQFGEKLFVSGDVEELGSNDATKALPLEYLNSEFY